MILPQHFIWKMLSRALCWMIVWSVSPFFCNLKVIVISLLRLVFLSIIAILILFLNNWKILMQSLRLRFSLWFLNDKYSQNVMPKRGFRLLTTLHVIFGKFVPVFLRKIWKRIWVLYFDCTYKYFSPSHEILYYCNFTIKTLWNSAYVRLKRCCMYVVISSDASTAVGLLLFSS